MDIAALSTGLSQASLSQDISMAVTTKAIDAAQQNANQIVEMIQAPHPNLGNSIDLKG